MFIIEISIITILCSIKLLKYSLTKNQIFMSDMKTEITLPYIRRNNITFNAIIRRFKYYSTSPANITLVKRLSSKR